MKSVAICVLLACFTAFIAMAADDAQKIYDLDSIMAQMKKIYVPIDSDATSAGAKKRRRQENKKLKRHLRDALLNFLA